MPYFVYILLIGIRRRKMGDAVYLEVVPFVQDKRKGEDRVSLVAGKGMGGTCKAHSCEEGNRQCAERQKQQVRRFVPAVGTERGSQYSAHLGPILLTRFFG